MAISMRNRYGYVFVIGSFLVWKSSADDHATKPAQILQYAPGWYDNTYSPPMEPVFPYLARVFNTSENACFIEGNAIRFASGKDGTLTHSFLFSAPPNLCGQQDFEVKIGSTKVVKGIQYVYTAEVVDDVRVLRASYSRLDGTSSFTLDISFGDTELNATFTGDNDTDTSLTLPYSRVLPQYAKGSFASDPKTVSDKWTALFQSAFSPAKDAKWSQNVRYSVEEYSPQLPPFDRLTHKFSPEPSYDKYISFAINKKRNTTWEKSPVQYKFRITATTLDSTTLQGDFQRSTGNFNITFEYGDGKRKGVSVTIKSGSSQATAFFDSVLPSTFDGTFRETRDDPGWEEFVASGGWDLADSTTELTVRRDVKRKNQYFLIRKLKGNKTLESSFNFDAYTPAILNGDKFQYKFGSSDKSNFAIRGEGTINKAGKSFKILEEIHPSYFDSDSLSANYDRTSIVDQSSIPFVSGARRFQRVLPLEVFGKFESVQGKDELKAFAKFYDIPEVLQKTTVEIYPDEDQSRRTHYTQKLQYGNDPVIDLKFSLGEHYYHENIHNKTTDTPTDRSCDFVLLDGQPVLRWHFRRDGDSYGYDLVQVFSKTGINATYTYDREGGEKIIRQEFRRTGPARKAAAA